VKMAKMKRKWRQNINNRSENRQKISMAKYEMKSIEASAAGIENNNGDGGNNETA